MTAKASRAALLIAEDDDEDFLLLKKALPGSPFVTMHRLRDGDELLDFLLARGGYRGSQALPSSFVVLLDLDMPRVDGRQVLRALRSRPELRRIPVVVLSGAATEADVDLVYELGANSFIRKPAGFQRFSQAMHRLQEYWFETVSLPSCEEQRPGAAGKGR